jgi:hypothetical protein
MNTSTWQLETDAQKASRLTVSFTADGDRKRVVLVHTDFWRLPDGGQGMADAVAAAPEGCDLGLQGFRIRLADIELGRWRHRQRLRPSEQPVDRYRPPIGLRVDGDPRRDGVRTSRVVTVESPWPDAWWLLVICWRCGWHFLHLV